MKVWKQGVHSDIENKLKQKFTDKDLAPFFGSKLLAFFIDKEYGDGVKEILYRQFCFGPDFEQPKEPFFIYGKRKRIIDCVVNLDFDKAIELDVPNFAKYIAKMYLERSKNFSELEIKNFDCKAFISDLRTYFSINKLM